MSKKVVIKFSSMYERYVIKKIVDYNLSAKLYKEKNVYFYYIIDKADYNTLKKLDYKNIIEFERTYGNEFLSELIKINIEKIIVSLSIIFLIFLSKILILEVNIHTNDTSLKNKINYALMDENIHSLSKSKSFQKLNVVKNKILNRYKDEIEWIEISKHGYKYDVSIIKRKKSNNNVNYTKCNYVARKSGTVRSIKVNKGVLNISENNYVNAGDILISGDIIYNEELKASVCASGTITGEVWYKVNVTYPLKRKITISKKTKSYNLLLNLFNKKYVLLKNNTDDKKELFKLGNDFFGISLINNIKKIKKNNKYKPEEAEKSALELAKKRLKRKLPQKSHIISENILKKYINNDKIDLEVLIAVEEELGVIENY